MNIAKQDINFNNDLKHSYDNSGYIIINDFISKNECQLLISEQNNILNNISINNNLVKFDTYNQAHSKDKYFFDSARKINIFYEPDAFDSDNNLIKPLHQSVNKIGHALHDLNSIFKQFSYQNKFKKLFFDLGLTKPQIVQSMYLMKQPKIGNQVDLHQDSSFIYTEPETCLGLWFALEDATISNGCLWAIPDSHKQSLKYKYIKTGDSAEMIKLSNIKFNQDKAIPLEVKAGTMILLHGRLAHFSNYNHSDKSRHAYALHVVEQSAKYLESNWLQPTEENPFNTWV